MRRVLVTAVLLMAAPALAGDAVLVGDSVFYKGVARTVVAANFSVAPAATDSAFVAAAGAGLKIYVIGYDLHAGTAASTFQFNSKPAGAGTAISPVYPQIASGQKVVGPYAFPLYSTNANEGLSITTGAGTGNSVGTAWYFIAP
jgi:hypothetical protein